MAKTDCLLGKSCKENVDDLTRVVVQTKNGLEKKSLCERCINTLSASGVVSSENPVAEIFGSNFKNKSFDNFIVDPKLFRKYNKLLRDEYTKKTFQQEKYTKSHLQTLQTAKERAVSFSNKAKDQGGRLLIQGNPGTGKTHIMCGIAYDMIRNKLSVGGVSAIEFIGQITDTYNQRYASEQSTKEEIIHKISRADAVFIDNIGSSTITPGTRRNLTWLFDKVIQRSKVLVVSTTLTHAELFSKEKGIGPEAFDRLREPPSSQIELRVPSFRVIASRLERHFG